MLSQMPLPPSGNVNDAYFYVEAPWIKDLSIYNMSVDRSQYMDIDRHNGKYVFSMGRIGAYNSYIRFINDPNITLCPQPDNEISIEAYLYLDTDADGTYYLFAPYGYASTTQNHLCVFIRVSGGLCQLSYGKHYIEISPYRWVHILASWRNGHLREYTDGVLSHEDRYNVTTTQYPKTVCFNIGGNPNAYDMGLPGMFRYVRIWDHARNFDLDRFVPDP